MSTTFSILDRIPDSRFQLAPEGLDPLEHLADLTERALNRQQIALDVERRFRHGRRNACGDVLLRQDLHRRRSMHDSPRQIDDRIPETVRVIEGEDGLEIPQKKLFDELLEERLQTVPDRLGLHDRAADPLELGENGPEALGKLIDLVACFAKGKRHLPLLPIDDLWSKLLHRLEVEANRNDQAAKPLRDVLVQ